MAPAEPGSHEDNPGLGPADQSDPLLVWNNDTRLTNNIDAESDPTMAVDSLDCSFISWYRSGSHWFKRINLLGEDCFSEREICAGQFVAQRSGQYTERLGVDSHDNMHFILNAGGNLGLKYQEFSTSGNPLMQPLDLSGVGANNHTVGMAIGTNNRVYFAYEEDQANFSIIFYVDSDMTVHYGSIIERGVAGIVIGCDSAGNVHVLFRKWDEPSLFYSKFNADGQILIMSKKVLNETVGNGFSDPMPEIAIDYKGNIHLLQASRVNTVRSLSYMMLDNEGNLCVGPDTLTNSASGVTVMMMRSTIRDSIVETQRWFSQIQQYRTVRVLRRIQ
jgi:hypothetical protein